jgi:hypothetical protein
LQAGGRRFDPVQLHQFVLRLVVPDPQQTRRAEAVRQTVSASRFERFGFSVGLRDLEFVDN